MTSIAEWTQTALNAGALVTGGIVWKMYIENLKTTIGTKDAEMSLADKQTDYWREKAEELEKRTPEVVERVLADRIAIREREIEQLARDRAAESERSKALHEEVRLLQVTMDQTRGFREVLNLEAYEPGDAGYEEYVEWLGEREDSVVDIEVMYMGVARVDSGQLMITDPCYIDSKWLDQPYDNIRRYTDTQTGGVVEWDPFQQRFDQPLPPFDQTVGDLVELGRLVELPPPPAPETFPYSYNGTAQATMSPEGFGELVFENGHEGAGVVFSSGWGDGYYSVYGEKHDGRIMRVYVNCGADPVVRPSVGGVS